MCCRRPWPPPAGTYSITQDVVISCSTPGSSIFYTDDGSTPTPSSTPYTVPVVVSTSQTLKAIATAPGYTDSAVGTAAYIIEATPTLVLAPVVGASHIQGGHLFYTASLSWTSSITPDHFDIWRQVNGGGFAFLMTVTGSTDTFGDGGLASSWTYGEYDYLVLAKDASDNTLATSNTEIIIWFQITAGINSTGPIPGAGAGTGYYDGSTNGSFSSGSILANPTQVFGSNVTVAGFQQSAAFSNTIVLAIQGTNPQNYFTSFRFVDQSGNSYNLASSAAVYSTTDAPGSTTWQWQAVNSTPFGNGSTYPMTVNP
jgi:hypothetical protein